MYNAYEASITQELRQAAEYVTHALETGWGEITRTSRVIHKELNMPLFDFHSLRHTHTTLLLEAGANPLDVQERLGHSHLAITWKYAHNTDAIREQTNKILSTIFV